MLRSSCAKRSHDSARQAAQETVAPKATCWEPARHRHEHFRGTLPEERGLDTTPAALFGRSTGGSGPPLATIGLLAGRNVSAAAPLSIAEDTAAGLPQPSPGGSGATASQPKPGGMAGGSRVPLVMDESVDSFGSTADGAAVGGLRITMGSALVVFVSMEATAVTAAFSGATEASAGATLGLGMANMPAAPALPLTAFAARALPRVVWPSRPPRARVSLLLRPRLGCSAAWPSDGPLSAMGLTGSAAGAAATAAALRSPLPLACRSPLALPRPRPLLSPS